MGNFSKAVQAIIHLIKRGPLSLFIYKYQKVAKPKLRFEESRLVHERSSWGTYVVKVLFLKWEKEVKQDKRYAGQSLQDYELVFVEGSLGVGAATGAIFMICDWMSETNIGHASSNV